jgi:hypothetical protein
MLNLRSATALVTGVVPVPKPEPVAVEAEAYKGTVEYGLARWKVDFVETPDGVTVTLMSPTQAADIHRIGRA